MDPLEPDGRIGLYEDDVGLRQLVPAIPWTSESVSRDYWDDHLNDVFQKAAIPMNAVEAALNGLMPRVAGTTILNATVPASRSPVLQAQLSELTYGYDRFSYLSVKGCEGKVYRVYFERGVQPEFQQSLIALNRLSPMLISDARVGRPIPLSDPVQLARYLAGQLDD